MFPVPASNRAGGSCYTVRSKLNVGDHVAAALPRGHRGQQVRFAVQHTDAGRSEHLVTGEDEEVRVEFGHVHPQMRHGLRAVDQHARPGGVGGSDDLPDRCDGAERVGHLSDGHQSSSVGQ